MAAFMTTVYCFMFCIAIYAVGKTGYDGIRWLVDRAVDRLLGKKG